MQAMTFRPGGGSIIAATLDDDGEQWCNIAAVMMNTYPRYTKRKMKRDTVK